MNKDHYEINIKIPKTWIREIIRNYLIIGVISQIVYILRVGLDLRIIIGFAFFGAVAFIANYLQWRFHWVWMWILSYFMVIFFVLSLVFSVFMSIFGRR